MATTVRAVPILCARDLDRSLAFYMALGFETKPYAGGNGYAFLWWNGVEIHLSQSDTLLEGQNPGTGVYFYLEAGTAVAVESAFRGLGATITSPLSPRAWRMNEFVIVDPDANLLRFGEPLER